MAYHKNDFLSRLNAVEQAHKRNQKKAYVFNIYTDFSGPKAMKREFSKAKYRGCVLILNDIR